MNENKSKLAPLPELLGSLKALIEKYSQPAYDFEAADVNFKKGIAVSIYQILKEKRTWMPAADIRRHLQATDKMSTTMQAVYSALTRNQDLFTRNLKGEWTLREFIYKEVDSKSPS